MITKEQKAGQKIASDVAEIIAEELRKKAIKTRHTITSAKPSGLIAIGTDINIFAEDMDWATSDKARNALRAKIIPLVDEIQKHAVNNTICFVSAESPPAMMPGSVAIHDDVAVTVIEGYDYIDCSFIVRIEVIISNNAEN